MQVLKTDISLLRNKSACLLAGFVLALSFHTAFSQPSPREDQLKSVFLFNFVQFTEWPDKAFATPASPYVIGILGKDQLSPFLRQIMEGEKINGRPIQVTHFTSWEEMTDCHILFIEQSAADLVKNVLPKVKGKNVLTVSDIKNFTQQGGMIRLFTDSNKMRFEINLAVCKETELTLSSKLMRLALLCCDKKE